MPINLESAEKECTGWHFSAIVVFLFAGYFVSQAISEREKANRLLLNVLPKEIAPILKRSDKTIADHYASASVLFADIVGSTPLFSEMDWARDATASVIS